MDTICWHLFTHLDEVKSSTYILNSFKIMETKHFDEWQIATHPIIMWHVTISFIMVKVVTQLTFWLLKIQSICQKISLHWQLTQPMHVACMVAIKYSNVHNDLFVLIWYSKFIACIICVKFLHVCWWTQ